MTEKKIIEPRVMDCAGLLDAIRHMPEEHMNNKNFLVLSVLTNEDGSPDLQNQMSNMVLSGVATIPGFVFASMAIQNAFDEMTRDEIDSSVVAQIAAKLIKEINFRYLNATEKTQVLQ
jgi:hypothetical protein